MDEVSQAPTAPLLDEPLAVEFANTHFAVRGVPQEGLATPNHLATWLAHHANACGTVPPGTVTEPDRRRFVALRDAIRAIATAVTKGHPLPGPAVAVVNNAAAAAPSWPQLVPDGIAATLTEQHGGDPLPAAQAAIGRSAVAVFGRPSRIQLRACAGPGCVLFFVKDHPRREWCSAGCGNRARVRRHHERHRP